MYISTNYNVFHSSADIYMLLLYTYHGHRLFDLHDTAQSTLDLERGPIGRVVVSDINPNAPQLMCFVLHHLVVDGKYISIVSYPILSYSYPIPILFLFLFLFLFLSYPIHSFSRFSATKQEIFGEYCICNLHLGSKY